MSMCIYHGNCADGFGAAWVVRKALGEIDFHPGKYQEPPPDVTGKDVVMVDFSYPHHTKHGEAPMRDLLMFESEAEAKRRDVHAEIRRALIRIESANAVQPSPTPSKQVRNP
jgi:hypothetical protein